MNFRTWLIVFAPLCLQAQARNESTIARTEKLFSLFNVVRFENSACTGLSTNDGTRTSGICYTASECTSSGGFFVGSCAAGFGICCGFIIRSSSGGTVTQNGTFIQAPEDQRSLADGGLISYRVIRHHLEVCFLRLDFVIFNILGPADTFETSGGACVDTFKATTATGASEICGINTGEHMYVDLGSNMESILQFMFGITPRGTMVVRDWNIKVDQIPCTGPTRPREGCLQHHTALIGKIKTFNFDGLTGHLANQRYSTCIRQAKDYCCIEYQVCPPPVMNPFSLNSAKNPIREGNCRLALMDQDYVLIPGASATCSRDTNRRLRSVFCGSTFNVLETPKENAPVCDCSPPFEVSFVTDNTAPPNQLLIPQGVCLVYRQVLC